ncbi:hypothetical protein EST62_10725 [Chlorobaculum sp. 24CR]|uniref:hypothetical protein n=1 Tax=Chlorobaculum sp. 24CR TaxID=2508878 RepID=UPI00100BF290|nr:hypothetical protein [Chlorobaculum sp. 24CR]RXK82270.1 hypothetical protein EST62_10725 [Chlorobaculum sp. 24CR]
MNLFTGFETKKGLRSPFFVFPSSRLLKGYAQMSTFFRVTRDADVSRCFVFFLKAPGGNQNIKVSTQ